MSNLTISVPADVLKRARIRAIEEGVSVNAVLARYLEGWAQPNELRRLRQNAADRLVQLGEQSQAGSGGRRWSRDELYER
ncbi:hypothetical protein [uncultured Thiohalocapsa sp.]|uniref:hypothetical protein n=1 Tax=uncultured Thiohalocapsa sp. TaxID=768990 RepID=UPI0026009ADA|nr:hypothetical protein [uncultured Thiohalocapsa sp.]